MTVSLYLSSRALHLAPTSPPSAPSKHIRPQDTNNYMQLSVMIHSGPKAGITAWGEIVLSAPLLGLSLRVRSSLEIGDRKRKERQEKRDPCLSTPLEICWHAEEVLCIEQHS